MTGKVVRILTDKGFGFIRDENNKEYFFHYTEATDFQYLSVGDEVTFQEGRSVKGPRATHVTKD